MHNGFVDIFAPWDGRRVPVTLLGGYLGAGKTTLLNAVLARTDRPIAVLVNEIGSVNIDAGLIKSRSGDTIELTDGCVCCDVSSGLDDAFEMLRQRDVPPDHVIIELSGAAQPQRVEMWANSPGFRLDGVVVLVDVEAIADLLAGPVSHLVIAQIEAADLIAFTKTDLSSEAQLAGARTAVDRLAPGVPVIQSSDVAGLAPLVAIGGRRPKGVGDVAPQELFDLHSVRTVKVDQPVTRGALDELLDELPDSVVRAKGVFTTPEDSKLLVQVVGRRRKITTLPQAEFQESTDLVVIEV